MKKLILLPIITLLLSCSAEEKVRAAGECDCRTEYYRAVPPVGGGSLVYTFIFSEATKFDCLNDVYGYYFPVSNMNYNTAKVVCE
jgi:hypothetical protein